MKSSLSSALTTPTLERPRTSPAIIQHWQLAPNADATTISDDEIAAGVREELIRSGRLELRTVRVIVHRGRVRLQGRVSSYYLKQLAQTAALSTEGVEAVENELAVI